MAWGATVNRILGSCLRVFGEEEPVTYLPAAGGSLSLMGIFSSAHSELDVNSGVVVASNQPVLGVRLADFPSPPKPPNDRVTVRGITYKVRDCQEDGQGGAQLMLQRV